MTGRRGALRVVGGDLPAAPAGTGAAFERYAALVREMDDSPALRTSYAHNIAIVRAWAAWRDLFLAADRRAR